MSIGDFICVIIFGIILGIGLNVHGDETANITLAWDANEEPEITGYNLYTKHHVNETYTLLSEILEEDLDNPLMPQIKIWGLDKNLTHYFVCTAKTETQESGYSKEVSWTAPNTNERTAEKANGSSGGCFINSLMRP
jgi:hypothetical protein